VYAEEEAHMTAETQPSLPKRPLGATGLAVTPLCIGTAVLGSMPQVFHYEVHEAQALATLRAVFDGPINFLDTAGGYSDGESERRIGLAIRERGGLPPQFVLATKVDRDAETGDASPAQMRRSVERSLRLLGLERLQLVYIHDPEYSMTFEEVMAPGGHLAALQRCKEEGLIEHIGMAAGPIDLLIRYVETGAFAVVLSHNRYTLLNVAADRLWDVAAQHGVATINAAPYGGGLLSKGPGASPRYAYREAADAVIARVRRIEAICARHDVPLAAAALQFSLREPRIASTVVGISRPERLAHTLALARHPIPEALWAELAAVLPDTEDLR
jgi:D-threo-aldose 1-dehydrogenase